MKYYFDHRNYTDSFVKVIVDDVIIGYAFLKKNKITCLDIPNESSSVELWFSFTKFEGCRKIEKEVYNSDFFSFKQNNISQKFKNEKRDCYKFPYYCVINTINYNEDTYFYPTYLYPAIISDNILKGALIYQGVSLKNNENIHLTLKKDVEQGKNTDKVRKNNIIKAILTIIASIIVFTFATPRAFDNQIGFFTPKRYGCLFYLSLIFFPLGLFGFIDNIIYNGMFDFRKLPDELYI